MAVETFDLEEQRPDPKTMRNLLTLTTVASLMMLSQTVGAQANGTFTDDLSSGDTGPLMVVIPAGSFRMGCLNEGGACYLSQRPVHTVTIASFAISRYEITFDQWDACVDAGGCDGYRPDDRGWGRGDRPVIRLNWGHAKAYVSWLSQQTGKQYRLPTESEWEYAARAGTETTYEWGNQPGNNRANCDGCGSQWDGAQTAPIGSFAPNPWGLYDVHGNVWEWTEDCKGISSYTGAPTDGSAWLAAPCSMRILRGGGWDSQSDFCRASYRGTGDVDFGTDVMGLRVVRTLGVVRPDLTVAEPTVSDTGPAPGASVTLSVTVSNTGDGSSPATTLRYYRSADEAVSTSDTQVGTDSIGALIPGETTAESATVTVPSTVGTYYYGACVDAVTGESDTTDNCSASVRVDVQEATARPDLEVGQPTVSDGSPASGAAFTLSATVSNTGDGTSAATTLRYYRSSDSTVSTLDSLVGTDPVEALASNGTSTESASITAPVTSGTYYYGACVDAVSGESDTTDNCSASVRVDVRNVDTTAPTVTGATVDSASLVVNFDETLAAAANLANGAFTVKKTPSGGSETTLTLTGSPSISGAAVSLTLVAPVVSTDSVTVGYAKPTSGTGNTLKDASGNQVADFASQTATNNTEPVSPLTAWFDDVPDAHDGASAFMLELAFSEAVFDGNESFNRNQRIRSKVSVARGTLRGLRRVAPTQYDRWVLKIEPSGDDDVTVTLPADGTACDAGGVCTVDGRRLSGDASATVPGPSAEAPDAPSAPTLTTGQTWLEATWTTPNDNGAPITDYDVAYRETSGNWQDTGHAGTGSSKRIENLAADTAYEVRVRATNVVGASEWSPVAFGRTDAAPAEAPNAPSAPTLTAGTTWIQASWTAPSDNGAAITDYDVAYRVTGGSWQIADHTGTGTTKRIEGLSTDTDYEVRVRATNDAGTGAWSSAASGRTATVDSAVEGDVRLVNGSNDLEGRVEIYHDDEWGTVCDDRFVSDDAEVVCRQLGHTGGEVFGRAAFGAGNGKIWMDDVRCTGSESRLADCPFRGWGRHNCRHNEDVGVSCAAVSSLSLSSATIFGRTLILAYTRQLHDGSIPDSDDFVVASGGTVVPVASVDVVNGVVVLTLSREIDEAEAVTVSYLPAAMHPLEDTSLNPVPALTGIPVRRTETIPSIALFVTSDALSDPEKIEILDISANGLAYLEAVAGLTDLEALNLGGNDLADLWPLTSVTGLERLDLRDNHISDLSALSRLNGLRVLDLSGNTISDLSPLAGLTELRRLNLVGNRVSDLRPLSGLSRLEVLLLDGNEVTDLSPLRGLPYLAHLSIGDNHLTDFELLREMRALQRLNLVGIQLQDVSVLGDLPQLVWLRLSENPFVDLYPLVRLASLRWLILDADTLRTDPTMSTNAEEASLIPHETSGNKSDGRLK